MTIIATLKEIECCSCHTLFAMTQELYEQKLRQRHDQDKRAFYCPQGHAQWFTGETEAQRLQRQIQWEKERADRNHQSYISAERSARAQRGLVTRMRNRVHNGVCPDCKRTFQNLRRHMATKHSTPAAEATK